MELYVILRVLAFGSSLFLIAPLARGQTAANPENTGAQAVRAEQAAAPLPVAGPAFSPNTPVEPASIIPPNTLPAPGTTSLPAIPASPELKQLNELFKRSSLGKIADEHRLHVQMSALQIQIRNDADLQELKAAALEAPTQLEQRHGFRRYYELYYRKLLGRADSPELRDYLKAEEAAQELTLLQPRTRHETDEAEAGKLTIARAGASAAPLTTPTQARVNDVFNH